MEGDGAKRATDGAWARSGLVFVVAEQQGLDGVIATEVEEVPRDAPKLAQAWGWELGLPPPESRIGDISLEQEEGLAPTTSAGAEDVRRDAARMFPFYPVYPTSGGSRGGGRAGGWGTAS